MFEGSTILGGKTLLGFKICMGQKLWEVNICGWSTFILGQKNVGVNICLGSTKIGVEQFWEVKNVDKEARKQVVYPHSKKLSKVNHYWL